MTGGRRGWIGRAGLSFSAPAGMAGAAEIPIQHLAVDLAISLLAHGVSVAYGGNLAGERFTQPLFTRIRTYSDDTRRPETRLRLYLVAQESRSMPAEMRDELARQCDVVELPGASAAEPAEAWASSLSAMRERMVKEIDARVILGGRIAGGAGRYPGLLEEAWLAARESKPLYVLGGFGGCAGSVASTLRGGSPEEFSYEYQLQRSKGNAHLARDYDRVISALQAYGRCGMNSGLGPDENELLFTTTDIDLAIALVMRGLWTRGIRA